MNFNEWLSQNEGWNSGKPGLAYKSNYKPPLPRNMTQPTPQPMSNGVKPTDKPIAAGHNPADRQPPPQRQDNRFAGINDRVKYGKGIEKQIFDSLVACGMKLREPTSSEDMHDKIDGWWQSNGGKESPLQIKYRDTGDDILFEVMKDYDRGIPGRDMVGKAEYYAVLSRAGGKIVIVSVEDAKAIIREMVKESARKGFDDRGNYRKGGAILRIRPDPASGQDKLMAYIPINMLKQITPPCQAKVQF